MSPSAFTLDIIPDLPPHKVFLWNKWGQYLDYSFPNPVFGHFEDPNRLTGANVLEILPGCSGQTVLENIQHTLTSQKPRAFSIELPKQNNHSFQAIIRLFPLSMHVLGLVNDFPHLDLPTALPSLGTPPSPSSTLPKSRHPLTYREQQILQLVDQDFSNESIATALCISQRTVKFHLLNIYKKIGVSSRMSLQTVVPFLLNVTGNPHYIRST